MKQHILRITALTLTLLMLLIPMVACANTGTPLLTLKSDGKTYTYSVNLYELQLATVKGQLAANQVTIQGVKPTEAAFWDKKDSFDGTLQNIDDYYCEQILSECRYILVALCLFDRYGLTLSEAEQEKIDEYIEEFIKTDGGGSENKLNSVLADYSVNVEMLREHYLNAAKVSAVQQHLYNQLGNNIKSEYLNENYVHFDQLFLANFDYVYVTDKNGDDVYYDEKGTTVLYKETGWFDVNEKGVKVYYTDESKEHISYDTENGIRNYKRTEDGKSYETRAYDEEELKALENRAELLYGRAEELSAAEFALLVDEETEGDEFTDGYYLQKKLDYSEYGESYAYLDEILKKLEEAEDGDIIMVESASGFHIVMKQKPTEKAWENSVNDTWFSSSMGKGFEDSLTQIAFEDACGDLYDKIETDNAVLEAARNMKAVKPNYYYY